MKLIYLGCLSKKTYKDTCKNAIKIIKFLDSEYQDIDDVPCCGSLSYHVTSEKDLKEHVQFVNDWFKENRVTELITICAGCYSYLTNYYPKYLGSDFNVKVQHLLQFMNQPENLEKLNLKYEGKKLNLSSHPDGMMIGPALTNSEFVDCRADKIIAIEKGALFTRFVEERVHDRFKAILICLVSMTKSFL